jgi:uncharacterized protein
VQSEETRQLIRDFYECLSTGNLVHIVELLDSDVQWQMPASVPDNLIMGRDAVLRELTGATVKRLFEKGSFRLRVYSVLADGNIGIVQTGTQAKTKAGNTYRMEYVWIYTCQENRIIQIREYLDTALSFACMGWSVNPLDGLAKLAVLE